MPYPMILILVASGCLMLLQQRNTNAEIYGTYSVFDRLGSYHDPAKSPFKNVTIIQKKIVNPISKTLLQVTSPTQSHQQQQQQQQHNEHETRTPPVTQHQQANTQQQQQQQQHIYQPAPPLEIPQYEDSIARPFTDVNADHSTASSNANTVNTAAGTSTTPGSTSTALQAPTAVPGSAGSQSQARVPLYVYNPGLARRLGLGTFMMGSVLYGLTLLPALLAVGATSGVGPFAGLISSLSGSESSRRRKRKKRSNPPPLVSSNAYRFREMPLLDNSSSYKFLSLVENTMEIRKIEEAMCKKFYVCKIYQTALENNERPSPQDFEIAVIDTFGIAAERTGYKLDLISTVRYYLDAALVGLMRGNCSKIFPCAEPLFRFFPLWSDQKNYKSYK